MADFLKVSCGRHVFLMSNSQIYYLNINIYYLTSTTLPFLSLVYRLAALPYYIKPISYPLPFLSTILQTSVYTSTLGLCVCLRCHSFKKLLETLEYLCSNKTFTFFLTGRDLYSNISRYLPRLKIVYLVLNLEKMCIPMDL